MPAEWDDDVPVSGTLEVHWSVTMDEAGEPQLWISPYQLMPDTDEHLEQAGTRSGSACTLMRPLRHHEDRHLVMAGQTVSELAIREWIKPYLSARLGRAMIEQRDRSGGYIEGTDPWVDLDVPDTTPEEEYGEG